LIGDHLKSDVITCIGPIQQPFDDIIRDFVEDIPSRRESLLVILETDGGSIETAEGIADAIFRQHYAKEVSFLIPNFAMSAGTVLVMSGDTIYMDYYSILGPIDPQVLRDGRFVPALGYLDKYNELVAKSKRRAGLSQAELVDGI
jgi:ClpP class serine protease